MFPGKNIDAINTIKTPALNATQSYQLLHHLRFVPQQLNKTYGVVLRFNTKQSLHYEITVRFLKTLGDGSYLVELNRGQVYINEQAPATIVDQLADACGKVLYPLQLVVTPAGEWLAILNSSDIAQRWEAAREKITQYYQGPVVKDAVHYMNQAVNSRQHLHASLQQDWFAMLYFAGIHRYQLKESTSLLPVMPYCRPVSFAVSNEWTTAAEKDDYITLQQNGHCSDARCAEDLLKGHPVAIYEQLNGTGTPLQGQLNLQYQLYPSDFSIHAIQGNCRLTLVNGEEKEVEIAVYHLPEKDSSTLQDALAKEAQQKEQEKKKSRFSLFR